VQSNHIVHDRILRQLSADELKSVQPWLTPVQLQSNTVLHEPGKTIERIYFPLSGMISLLSVMQSGEQIEIGIVGADGLVGGRCRHRWTVCRATDGPIGWHCCEDAQGPIRRGLSEAPAPTKLS
jgi:hypothetical protein